MLHSAFTANILFVLKVEWTEIVRLGGCSWAGVRRCTPARSSTAVAVAGVGGPRVALEPHGAAVAAPRTVGVHLVDVVHVPVRALDLRLVVTALRLLRLCCVHLNHTLSRCS